MKPIVQKILEAGLVDKHTALLMERWGTLDRGASELVGKEDLRKASEEVLLQFVEDVDNLVEDERRRVQETRFSIGVSDPLLVRPLRWTVGQIVVFRDEMENFIFPENQRGREWFAVGNRFSQLSTPDAVWEIEEINPLYVGENLYAYQVRVKKV